MKTAVQFQNLEKLEHLSSFVKAAAISSLEKFEAWRVFNTNIILKIVKPRSDFHGPIYECDLRISGKGINKPIVVKKKASDFYGSVRDCLLATEKILRRESKLRVSKRRNNLVRSSEPAV